MMETLLVLLLHLYQINNLGHEKGHYQTPHHFSESNMP